MKIVDSYNFKEYDFIYNIRFPINYKTLDYVNKKVLIIIGFRFDAKLKNVLEKLYLNNNCTIMFGYGLEYSSMIRTKPFLSMLDYQKKLEWLNDNL